MWQVFKQDSLRSEHFYILTHSLCSLKGYSILQVCQCKYPTVKNLLFNDKVNLVRYLLHKQERNSITNILASITIAVMKGVKT